MESWYNLVESAHEFDCCLDLIMFLQNDKSLIENV